MATLNIPNSFTNGYVANANDVNTNFQSIKTFCEASLVSADGAVQAGTAAIANNAIIEAKIASDAVTAAKIAINSVGTTKIIDAAVTLDKLAFALPRGVVARTSVTSDSSAASTSQVSIFPTVTFSAVANRLYMVHASCFLEVADNVTGDFFANLVDSSTTVQNLMFTAQSDYIVGDIIRPRITSNFLYAPVTTVTQSFNINIARLTGSGTIKNLASATNPSHLTIIDVGGVV